MNENVDRLDELISLKRNPLTDGMKLKSGISLTPDQVKEVVENCPHYNPESISTHDAVRALSSAISSDEGYMISWKSNIAMAVFDSIINFKAENGAVRLNHAQIHECCNKGAELFIKTLINH